MATRRDITTLIDSTPEILRLVGSEVGQTVSRIEEPPTSTAEWTGAAGDAQRWEIAEQRLDLADSREKLANGVAALDRYVDVAQRARVDATMSVQQYDHGTELEGWVRQHSGLTLTWESMRLLTSAFDDSLRHQEQGVWGMQASGDAVLVASNDLHGVLARNVPGPTDTLGTQGELYALPIQDALQNPIENRPMPPVSPEEGTTVEPADDQPVNRPGAVPEYHLEISNQNFELRDMSKALWKWRGLELALEEQAWGKIGAYNGVLDGMFNNAMTTRVIQARERVRHWNETFDAISQATQRRAGELQVRSNEAVQQYGQGASQVRSADSLDDGLDRTERRMDRSRGQAQQSVTQTQAIVDSAARNNPASNNLSIARMVERYPVDPNEAAALQGLFEDTQKKHGFLNGDALEQFIDEHEELDPAPFSGMNFTEEEHRLPIKEGSVLVDQDPDDVPTPPSLQSERKRVDEIRTEGATQMEQAAAELDDIESDAAKLPTGMPKPDLESNPSFPFRDDVGRPERPTVPPAKIQQYIDEQRDDLRVGEGIQTFADSWENARGSIPGGELLPRWPTWPTVSDHAHTSFLLSYEDNVKFDRWNNLNTEYVRQQAAEGRYELENQGRLDSAQTQESRDANQRITTENLTNGLTQQSENVVEDNTQQDQNQKEALAISTSAEAKEQSFQGSLQNYLRSVDREAAAVTSTYGAVVPQLGHMAAHQGQLSPELFKWWAYIRHETADRPAVEQYTALEWGMRELRRVGLITPADYTYYQGEFQDPIPQRAPTPVDELINRKPNY
ncbi:MAG: hypothetical protein ACRCYR_20000 [Phycicoccus sp.]